MSEQPKENSPVVGIVTAAEAQMLANVPTNETNTDPEALAILQRIGATALEGTDRAFALVVEEGDEGQKTPVRYIDIRGRDLGTSVKPNMFDEYGLSQPAEAYEQLNRIHDLKDSQEVEGKTKLDEIVENTDLLLNPNLLRDALLSPANLVEGKTDDEIATRNKVEFIKATAIQEIAGPEASVLESAAVLKQSGEEISDEMRRVKVNMDAVDEALENSDKLITPMADELPGARRAIQTLRDMMNDPQAMRNEEWRYYTRTLSDFSETYERILNKRDAGATEAVDYGRRVLNGVEQTDEDVRRTQSRLNNAVEEARLAPFSKTSIDEIVSAIEKRGASSIAEHKTACEADVDAEGNKLNEARQAFSSLDQEVRGLFSMLINREGETTFPRTQLLRDYVDTASSYLYRLSQGEGMFARLTDEALEGVQYTFSKIEQAIEEETQVTASVRKKAAESIQSIDTINRLSFFSGE